MTLQCLPEIIRESLLTIIGERNFSSRAVFNITRRADTEISSSFNLEILDNSRKCYLFLKYLNCIQGDFSEQALVFFRNEVVFYGKILTEFQTLVDASGGKCMNLTFAPRCLGVGSTLTEQPFILMEDLVSKGYTPLDVKQPLSLEPALAVLRQLGRFHGLSFAMRHKHPHIFEKATSQFHETTFREEARGTLGKLFIHSIHDVLKLAKQAFPSDSVYVEKFTTFALNIFEKMVNLIRGDDEDAYYKVVTHGDLWPNNILCKRSENDTKTIQDVKFIDYQACRLSSPAHDLQLFLLIGLDKSTREQHRAALIGCYHTSLCETLHILGCDPLMIFPLSALQNQLAKQSRFALAVALAGLPLMLNEESSATEIRHTETLSKCSGRTSNADTLLEYVQVAHRRKSMRCKNKILEIVMDVVDQGYL